MDSKDQVDKLKKKISQLENKSAKFIEFKDFNDKLKPLATLANTKMLLDHHGISVKYNEMLKETEINISGQRFHGDTKANVQLTYIEDLARQSDLPDTKIDVHLGLIANQQAYHPVREWIKSIKWDGKSRLEDYYATITSITPTKKLYMRKWALSVVAACFREDYQFGAEGILTFLGGQAAAKTTWAESIFPKDSTSKGWVKTGCSIDPHNKDTLLIALSSLVVEMGEMGTSFRKADKEALKAFTTNKVDYLRPPYAVKTNTYSRRTVFFGTTNEIQILNDTENRRFWPLEDVNFPKHKLDVAQFWAEMYDMYLKVLPLMETRQHSMISGEWGWFLSPAERAQLQIDQEDFRTISPVIEKIEHSISDVASTLHYNSVLEWVGATLICERSGVVNPNKAAANEAAEWLKKQGYPYQKNTKKYGVIFNKTSGDAGDADVARIVAGIKKTIAKAKG